MTASAPALRLLEPADEAGSEPGRCDVAMLVATRNDGRLVHACFTDLPSHLRPGDLLVVNTSATLPAAVPARLAGRAVRLHFSTPAGESRWVVELRTADGHPFRAPPRGSRLDLPGGAHAVLLGRHGGSARLSVAELALGAPVEEYLAIHGAPIRYRHDRRGRPIGDYQTVFALDPGSAEMPSAGRPFTTALVTELVARGVLVAPIMLHAGVSSLDKGERPFPERFRVPAATARLANAVHGWGGRVIAVGTTVVRALETVADEHGTVCAGEGETSLVITPERGLHAVDGLLTGWHEPESSHLDMLGAAAGADLLERSYRAARRHGYQWHEFGDMHLILGA